ncbi:SDR family oxidoreductase [Fodinicola acaciae]|uniref:SDR family oxidoreductase n=1 Tax=Fodinicola acaciae TaxID=2681555 RepID=UPI001C9E508B|nr:SDR family oxidoreductase [Fodinicola acaciae]
MTVVAITGGARGIGLATARTLLATGAKVAIGDLDSAASAADELGCFGTDLDVTDRASFARFLDETERELGPIDALVNNAGIMPLGTFADEDDDLTHRIVDVNLHGVILGMKLAIARMVPRGRGHIVNVSSGVGRVALAGAATYSATKHAIIGLSEATRAELRGTGVDVSVMVPMIVNTELGSGLSTVRGARTVEAADVAAAIAGVLRKPRFETWIPRSGRLLYRMAVLLPRPLAEALGRGTGAADVLATADTAARDAYEKRARNGA